MIRKVLVLGASDYIGDAVVRELSIAGNLQVVADVPKKPMDAWGGGSSLESRSVSVTDADSVHGAIEGMDAVVNCIVAAPGFLVASTRVLIHALRRRADPPRLVHLSSMSVYGSATGLLDETAALRGDVGPYSAAKVECEQLVGAYEPHVILRPGCEFSPGCELWSSRIARWLQAHRLGDLGAAGDGYCNWVHVDDIAAAVRRALEIPLKDGCIYNVAAPEPPTWNEFLTRYARALGAVPVRRISQRQLQVEARLLAPPLKICEILCRRSGLSAPWLPPPLPPSLLRSMAQEIRLDSRRARTELGIRWHTLDATLTETANWHLCRADTLT